MLLNKRKHEIRARLSVARMMSSCDTFSQPANQPTSQPANQPTSQPTNQPTINSSFFELFSKLYLLFNIPYCRPELYLHAN